MGLPIPFRPLAALASLLWLAACTEAAGPSFYLLESPARPAPTAVAEAGPVVGLREVALPLYARRPQIPVLEANGSVAVSDANRWAEEPARAVSRLIAGVVAAEIGRPVLVEPWPPEIAPEQRVDVEIDYLIGALGGELRLEGQLRTLATGRPESAVTRPFAITEPVSGTTYGDLVAAHGRALAALGRTIAADLARLGP